MTPRRPSAFSLVELLVVVAIIALLATVTIVAFSPAGNARALAKAAADLAGILELSRAHAMANNTAVSLKLTPDNDEKKLSVEVFDQRPGEEDSKPLQRKRTFENITMSTDPSNLTEFRFNSRGELQTTNAIPIQSLDIVLKPISTSNNATVSIKGLTGTISVSQPDS
jgi:prepilin-type N-terminal cleavage/methylation domain-containing protein